MKEPEFCSLCTFKALRHVGAKGFCKTHEPEAWKAEARAGKLHSSEAAIHEFLPDNLQHGRRWRHPEEKASWYL